MGAGTLGGGLNKRKIRKSVENFRKPNESSEGRLLMEIRRVWTVSAKAVLGYETSHHQLNELKAHLVRRQEPEGWIGLIEGGLNLQLQGRKDCSKIQIRRFLQLGDHKGSPGGGGVSQPGSAREGSRKLKVPLSSTDVSSWDLFSFHSDLMILNDLFLIITGP